MGLRRLLTASAVFGACLLAGGSSARGLSATDLLDRYATGAFDAVVAELERDTTDYTTLLEELRRDAPAWLDAGGASDRARRELAAATFALEAARAGAWHEWKLIKMQPPMCAGEDCYWPKDVVYWKAPPLLIEWGCTLLRAREAPLPMERWWQRAALSVAQRSGDPQFLIGDVNIGRGALAGEIGNTQDEIKHLDHAVERFPQDTRFVLAQAIARDRHLHAEAMMAYRALENDPDVGGEAMMRLGAMQVRERSFVITPDTPPRSPQNADAAIRTFEKAETLTRDPYVVFLARYFKGQALERQGDLRRAEAAYRGAVAAVPNAQSATLALAALVFRDGRRSEAHALVAGMLGAQPAPSDPWRAYAFADDRFWPRLIARLRAEIHR